MIDNTIDFDTTSKETDFNLDERIIEAKDVLTRTVNWTTNCDSKAGIMLALIGVLLSFSLFNSRLIHLFQILLVNMKSSFSIWEILWLLILCFPIGLIIFGVFSLINALFARIDSSKYKEDGLITDSSIFFGSIASNQSFMEFLKKTNSEKKEYYLRDLQSQIYINSLIVKAKYENFNKGVMHSFIGFVLLIVVCLVMNTVFI